MAYFPSMAFLNILRVFTRPMSFHETFFMRFSSEIYKEMDVA